MIESRELDEACARAMGWTEHPGGKWRRPGVNTCRSGANAYCLTHERVHKQRCLPRFSVDPANIGMMEEWLRQNGWELRMENTTSDGSWEAEGWRENRCRLTDNTRGQSIQQVLARLIVAVVAADV